MSETIDAHWRSPRAAALGAGQEVHVVREWIGARPLADAALFVDILRDAYPDWLGDGPVDAYDPTKVKGKLRRNAFHVTNRLFMLPHEVRPLVDAEAITHLDVVRARSHDHPSLL